MGTDSKWHSKWWITGIILPVVATLIADKFEQVPFLTTLSNILASIKTFFLNILTYEFKIWHALVLLILLVILMFIIRLVKKSPLVERNIKPLFWNYKKDKLKNWLWSWDYEFDHRTEKYEIINMKPVCEYCDIKMLGDGNGRYLYNFYKCPKCDRTKQDYITGWETTADIEALIIDKIQKNQFTISN